MESVSDCVDPVQGGEVEEQTACLQNGLSPEEGGRDSCAQASAGEGASCPVTPRRAALLYPLKRFPLYRLFPRNGINTKQKLRAN